MPETCDKCGVADAVVDMFTTSKWCQGCVDEFVELIAEKRESVTPLLVWTGYRIHECAPLHDPDDGTVLGGVALDVFCADGSVYTFESFDDEVELAAACVDAIERFVR